MKAVHTGVNNRSLVKFCPLPAHHSVCSRARLIYLPVIGTSRCCITSKSPATKVLALDIFLPGPVRAGQRPISMHVGTRRTDSYTEMKISIILFVQQSSRLYGLCCEVSVPQPESPRGDVIRWPRDAAHIYSDVPCFIPAGIC